MGTKTIRQLYLQFDNLIPRSSLESSLWVSHYCSAHLLLVVGATVSFGKTITDVDGSIVQILARIAKLAWITVGDANPTCGYRLHSRI